MPIDLRLDPDELPLLSDLYELTMAASYFAIGYNERASFTLSVRRLPPRRGFLVAAGVERILEALEEFHFGQAALDALDALKIFSPDFLQFLSNLRFTGEVMAVPEGTIFFAEEPILEISGPLIEAQLLETLVMNQVGIAALIASKAARSVIAARGRRLIDFGLRRSQGVDAGLVAARSSYLGGFVGTSNVLAGSRYGIPLYGTMAHSYIMAHDREREAFEHFVALFPMLSTLLVDTYDTMRGVQNAIAVAQDLKSKGVKLQALRLDSGDIADLSFKTRRALDQSGLQEVSIFASGNLDEYRIRDLIQGGVPIDAFGVGTAMVVSADAPSLDLTYKLGEYRGVPRIKTSTNKLTLPGRKQIFRAFNSNGGLYADLIGLVDEGVTTVSREFKPAPAEVVPIMQRQFIDGHRIGPRPTLAESRERLLETMAKLEQRYKDLERPEPYPVKHTAALNATLVNERMRAERRQD
ncbi:MAG TPA: nicotinate phosphoribosyltransferase [Candidatus Binataceae bacterium]|nr:nicotinate phosphoribosyltransferase [Candidatus Binataceae bacterium]